MKIKEEKGSVAVVVIVAILFIVVLSTTIYFSAVNRKNTGEELTRQIKQAYEKDIENIDYVYASVVSERNQPNPPELKSNMELVKYENGNWVKDETNKNYSYIAGVGKEDNTKSKWANAKVTIDGVESYFVWIPRYAYKITYYTDDTKTTVSDTNNGYGSIDVVFLKGKTDKYIDKDGNEKTAKRVNQGGEPTKEYVVHPAFTNDVENGGWDKELTGLWIGKYETSLYDKETNENINTSSETEGNILLTEETNKNKAIAVQSNMTSWRYCTIGNMYANARNYSPNLESHMLKNSEWGAVAYLTHSQYGRNGTEISINNSENYITATGGDSATSTGNVYGIYDLSGGTHEYVASYYNGNDANQTSIDYGNTFASKDGTSDEYSTEYSDINESSEYKKGDATYETKSWNLDYNIFVNSTSPFFLHGGFFKDDSVAGIFNYSRHNGEAFGSITFRMCLVVDTNETVERNLYIYTKEQLERFRDRVNSGETFEGKTVYLMDDINLNNGKYTALDDGTITFDTTAEEWTPIGTNDNKFKGIFEGNNHTINGLYISQTTTENQGLFKTNYGTIQNLKLKNGKITSTQSNVGAVVGTNNGTVNNIENYVSIESTGAKTGGIVGYNYGTINNCSNHANIKKKNTGEARIGGICGMSYGTIERCYNKGNIISEGNHTGGIVGFNGREDYTVLGIVQKCYNESNINGYNNSAGIVGCNYNGIIDYCYNVGNVDGITGGTAGIVGNNGAKITKISNSYNIGKITSKGNSQGGIGCSTNSKEGYTINNCYYLKGTAPNISNGELITVTNSEAKEETFMKSQEFVNLLGAENWTIEQIKNNGYPILK